MFTKSQLLFLNDKKMALACSGGVDSMVLADCLLKYKFDFSIIHCNFQLRGEGSFEDEKFVKSYAAKNNLRSFTKSFDTENSAKLNSTSIEMEARNLRYKFFQEIYHQQELDLILLAHHQNDQAETIFMRLIKGTGLSGLSGMKEIRDDIYFRPFLNITKETILDYARENKIEYREDASNNENIYQRNHIRNKILPSIDKINPSFRSALIHLGNLSSQTKSLIDDVCYSLTEIWDSTGNLDLTHYTDKPYLPLIISHILDKEISHKDQLEYIVHALSSQESKFFQLSSYEIEVKNFRISKISEVHSKIKIYHALHDLISDSAFHTEIVENKPNLFNETSLYIDIDKLNFPINARPMQIGDKIKPFGMRGLSRKLSDIAQELQWSRSEKLSNRVFVDGDNDIIAILGYRISEKVKLDSKTKTILIIRQ
ncbi:MAG: tRNA lysidine(34) synthetase TilS [Chitinophagales bacterium]|nr:tRNA lysidine(34) synthetase TilS [Chitinophagales bacterium]